MSILGKLKETFNQQNKVVDISTTPNGTTNDAVSFIRSTDNLGIKKSEFLEEFQGWVASAVDAISDQIANIDIRLFELKGDEEVEEVKEHEALEVLHRINNFTTKFDHFSLTSAFLELTGESPWLVDREDGKVVNIFFLVPTKLRPIADKHRNIIGYEYQIGRERFFLKFEDVIFLKFPNPADPFRGKGTLEKAARIVDVDNFSEEWNRQFYKNSARPDSIISLKIDQMSDEQKDKLKESLKKQYQGINKAHNTMVLFGEMDFHNSGFNQKDMDFDNQQHFSRDKILGIFRVPKAIVSQTEGVNFASAKVAIDIFLKFTITPKMERIVQQLNEFYLPMFENTENLFFSFVDPSPDDTESKSEVFERAIKTGWMTINEVRQEINLPDAEGGDVIYLPLNVAPIGTPQEVKELSVKKKRVFPNIVNIPGRIQQMKARNKDHFSKQRDRIQLKETKEEIKEAVKKIIKKEVFKSVKQKEKVDTQSNQWNEEEKLDFWKNKDVLSDKHLPEMSKAVNKEFKRQRKQVMTSFNKLKRQKQTTKEIFNKVKLNEKKETELMLDATFEINEEIFKESGDDTFESIGTGQTMDTSTDEIQKILNDLGTRTYSSVNAVTNDRINKAIADGLANGESLDEIQDRVRKFFVEAEKFRADRIARTETVRYTNEASQQAFIDSKVVEQKEWFVNPGACEFCRPLNGKRLPLDGNYFNLGDTATGELGGKLDLNFDTTEAPPLHVNCKCFIDRQIPIFTSKGWKEIGDIKVDDLVLTHKNRFRKVTELIRTPKQRPDVTTLEFNFALNKRKSKRKKMEENLTLTSNHPVMVNGKWIDAGKVKKGDKVRLLASHCVNCGEKIPWFRKVCSRECNSLAITARQWADPEHQKNVSERMSSFMKKQWENNKDIHLKQLENARKNVKECVLSRPDVIKKAHQSCGRRNYGKSWLEEKVGWALINNGIEIESQFTIEQDKPDILGRVRYYFADFKIKGQDILIECDGKAWHKDERIEKDKIRQKYIESKGYTVLRFTEDMINNNLQNVVLEVQRLMSNHSGEYSTIEVEVDNVKHWIPKKPKMLYNFSVSEDESYIAKGFVVHNCILVPVFIKTRSVKKKKCGCGEKHDVDYNKELKKQKTEELDEALKIFDEENEKSKKTNKELEKLRQDLINKYNQQIDEE